MLEAFIEDTRVETKYAPLAHHKAGLQFTRSGYGKRIPTAWMVKVGKYWRRVYCCCYSNSGTLYIGGLKKTPWTIVRTY